MSANTFLPRVFGGATAVHRNRQNDDSLKRIVTGHGRRHRRVEITETTMPETRDTAGVIAPPPLLAAAVIVLGLILDWLLPAYVLTVLLSLVVRAVVGAALMAAGFALIIPANFAFRSAGTNVEPWKPSVTLVVDGVFAWLRNPMYVGGTLFLVGFAILLASDWMLVMTVIFVVVLHSA
jgi:protein-S-isoprenylcysteine O-methyltransferase Ste14